MKGCLVSGLMWVSDPEEFSCEFAVKLLPDGGVDLIFTKGILRIPCFLSDGERILQALNTLRQGVPEPARQEAAQR